MSTEIQIAILGIIGTLLGTVLGWFLNSLSQKGKIRVFVKKWKATYQKADKMGGFVDCTREEAGYYHYNLSLDAYNSSRETRIMRDIRVVFWDKKNPLFSNIPKDDTTKRTSNTLIRYDEISIINIPAKTAVAINLHGGLYSSDKEWPDFLKACRVKLGYKNEKNKKKMIDVCRVVVNENNDSE